MNKCFDEKYREMSVTYGNIHMYFVKIAKRLIEDCERKRINILALEAFKLSGYGIQPSQEHSVYFDANEKNWSKALDFLSLDSNSEFLYEVWYEGY